jgi:ankyrin repeat protein
MGNQAGTLAGVIYANDLPGVRYRLELGDDINERRGSRYTPLITAAYYNRCEVIELVLDRGADVEAVEKSGLSALRTAIHYNNAEAAKLLAARGADANKIAYQNKTALYAAVEKGMRSVVEALLQNGADPRVKCGNDKSAFDLVSNGDLWDLLHSFTSFDVAINARSVPAVTFFLKKTLARNDSDDILKAYATVKTALVTALGEWQYCLSKLVDQFEIDMLRHALRSRPTDFVDMVNAAVGKPSWLSTARLNEKGQTALHVAVLCGDIAVVCHLLENFQCDLNAFDDDGCRAADLVKENDALKHISWILAQHEMKARFNGATCRLMGQNDMSALKLLELPQFMTSIYDMRVLFCLGYGALSTAEMKQLVRNAFTEAVRKKLMFDDDALTFSRPCWTNASASVCSRSRRSTAGRSRPGT